MDRAEPPVCAELRVDMMPATVIAAVKPMPQAAANARRVNAAGDAAEPLMEITPLLSAAAADGSDCTVPLRLGRTSHAD